MKACKKILSVLLCLCMVLSLCGTAFAAEKPLKITVTTDTHYKSFADMGTIENDPSVQTFTNGQLDPVLYGYASTQGQMDYESGAILKSMLADFVRSDSEYLLIGGDLTCGKRQSHLEFATLLREAEKQSGKQIFVTCGNHDCDPDDEKYINIDEFKEIYADFGWDKALETDPTSASYTADLNDTYRLLALDSCVYGEDDGKLGKDKLDWIEAQAEAAEQDGKTLIALMHHSILPHFYVQPMLDNYRKIAEKFADWGIGIVFTGHIHANDISSAVSGKGNPIYDIQTGSLISSPNAYREVTLTQNDVQIESKYVTKINTADLPQGFTAEQLRRIEADFPAYAAGYFESGICRWINRNIGSAGKVGKLLKLDAGSAMYKGLDDLMLLIGDALHLPLYDDGKTPGKADSLEEIAALGGYTIPKSDYQRLYQVMAAFMHGFYCGDEPESLLTVEVPLLLTSIKAALAQSLYSINCGKADALVQKVLGVSLRERALKGLSRALYAKTMANRLVDAILVPLTDGLSADLSEPADVNCTITLQSVPTDVVPLRFIDQLIAFIRAVFGL